MHQPRQLGGYPAKARSRARAGCPGGPRRARLSATRAGPERVFAQLRNKYPSPPLPASRASRRGPGRTGGAGSSGLRGQMIQRLVHVAWRSIATHRGADVDQCELDTSLPHMFQEHSTKPCVLDRQGLARAACETKRFFGTGDNFMKHCLLVRWY